ncbi:hypothetical protein NUW58_g6088 [Xylaria curta]|uniref:Uncharacterized protein n=1 Tax=Xylaria curta TaxID=42375 RepID=A0ACC1P138_9PEZI|nr:hypothetical protein NUW58_g6088 [Xylaria curta]
MTESRGTNLKLVALGAHGSFHCRTPGQSGYLDDEARKPPYYNYRLTRKQSKALVRELRSKVDYRMHEEELREPILDGLDGYDFDDVYETKRVVPLELVDVNIEDGGLIGANNIPWWEDRTNHDPTLTLRNSVRHMCKNYTLPVALQKPSILALSRRCEQKAQALEAEADRLLAQTIIHDLESNVGSASVQFPEYGLSRFPRDMSSPLRRHARIQRQREVVGLLIKRIIALVSPEEQPVLLANLQNTISYLFPALLNSDEQKTLERPKAFGIAGVHFVPIEPSPSRRAGGSLIWYLSRTPYPSNVPIPRYRHPYWSPPMRHTLSWHLHSEAYYVPVHIPLNPREPAAGAADSAIRIRPPLFAVFSPHLVLPHSISPPKKPGSPPTPAHRVNALRESRMTVTALTALVVKACSVLALASLALQVSAQDANAQASTNPQDFADWANNSKMALVIETAANAPYGSQYEVVPLTTEAGLNQMDASKIPEISGELVILDYSNFTRVDFTDKVVFLSCDATNSTDPNLITPNRMLNSIMNNPASPAAILLYSTTQAICYLGGSHRTYNRVWTMASQADAVQVRAILAATDTDAAVASITPGSKAVDTQPPRPGTSTIAMSILYSITGLITLLFLLIIATGAIRAHRNPERYGPRPGANGRPRRSRARGLAMAMLETLPIVKFGENDERKPDEETALENTSRVEPQPQGASRVVTGNAPNNDAAPESSEVANGATSQREPASSTPDKAKKEPEPEDNHLGCSICTEDFTVGEDVRVLPCNHKFHPACVDPWLVNVSGTCPLCRLDLRPPEDIERGENNETVAAPDATTPTDGHLAPPTETDQSATDERLQALRPIQTVAAGSDLASGTTDDERRHSRLTDRLRERLHIRHDSRSGAVTPEDSPPAASNVQQ